MSRSRSSFDVDGAIATATSLSTSDDPTSPYRGVALVSFGNPATIAPPPPAPETPAPERTRAPAPPAAVEPASIDEVGAGAEAARRPPKLPDLSGETSPVVRCARIVEWVAEATGATDVFLADSAGLPIAGAIADAEARLAGAGVVASSVAQLAAAIPGNASSLFELHIGEGPFFQLVGFEVAGTPYLVGLTRATPLTYRQAHAIRLACRHALGEPSSPPGGGAA